MPAQTADAATGGGHSIGRVAIASAIGATIEWYDFFLYGVVAALVFNKLFFPSYDPLVATLLSYTTFAVGFVARPVGGIIFGHFGDRVGRKTILVLTLLIMGLATTAIGLLPSYGTIGIAAPIILLVLRVLQDIGIGGGWGRRRADVGRARAGRAQRLLRQLSADRGSRRADAGVWRRGDPVPARQRRVHRVGLAGGVSAERRPGRSGPGDPP